MTRLAPRPVLVVHADDAARSALRRILSAADQDVYLTSSVDEGLAALVQIGPAVVVLAVDEEADIHAIRAFREGSEVPVVAVAAEPSVAASVEAIRSGAAGYCGLRDRPALAAAVKRAREESVAEGALRRAERAVKDTYGFKHLVSQSPRMLEVFDQVQAVAPTDANVLIRGETGTGKELISRAIHQRSRRREQPMIAVNCGAFSESLLESELFGHERGSFTGAVGRREGVFEMADGGTLFLDELGETSLNVQVSLLRVLEEFRFRRVGGRDPVDVDVRIVAATHVGLESAVAEKRFREDLYYRLNVFPITLPPLRERSEDISLLMRHFLDEIAESYGMDAPVVSAEALGAILHYHWPGNVRQLRAMCERWVITRAGQRLEVHHLPSTMGAHAPADRRTAFRIDDRATLKDNLSPVTEQVERAYLHRVLRRCGGRLAQTADVAGITRRTLYTKMKQYELSAADFRVSGSEETPS